MTDSGLEWAYFRSSSIRWAFLAKCESELPEWLRREEFQKFQKSIQSLNDTTACCVVGGSAWNSLRGNPARAKMACNSANV